MIKNLDEKWPEPPVGTRDRLLHLLDAFEGIRDGEQMTYQLNEIRIIMPGVKPPRTALTLGDLRILADIAIHHEYAMDGETGSEIAVEQ